MIKFHGISKSYGNQIVFEDVSFSINKKEKCALVGPNGTGKTTLLRLLSGEEEASSGSISFSRGYKVGILKQHLATTKSTILEEAALGLQKNSSDQLYLVETILFGLGFGKEDLAKHPSTFSGGFLIRVHLCKLLVSDPDCLLLDEPSNYLDIVSLRWLVKFLQEWKKESIIISHDREFLDQVSTHTLGIHRNGIKKIQGGTEEYYSQIYLEEEIQEKTRLNVEKKRAHMQSFVDRFGAKATKAAQAQSRVKAINKLPILEKLANLHHLNFSFRYSPFYSQKVLSAVQISFAYPKMDRSIIKNFDLLIENGDKIAIIGKNGKGKSTLLQLLALNLKPQQGVIKVGENVKIGYFGQTHIDRLNPAKTIYEEIANANPELNYSSVKSICGTMMFPGDASDKRIGILSGGERSRVLLGKILATPCNFLLLDEPTNHLDMESIEVLVSAIESFPGAVALVTHTEWILRRIPKKLIICREEDKMVFEGSYDDFLEKIGWEELNVRETKIKQSKPLQRINSHPSAFLKKQLESLEKKITLAQVSLEEQMNKLMNATEEQNWSEVSNINGLIKKKEKELSELFNKYEILTAEYEKA